MSQPFFIFVQEIFSRFSVSRRRDARAKASAGTGEERVAIGGTGRCDFLSRQPCESFLRLLGC
jgi:hypothetical protein